MAAFESANLRAIRGAIEQARELASEFHTATAKFYEEGNTTPVLVTSARMRKPRPSAFDASNQTEWATKRVVVLKVPLDVTTGIIEKGLMVQIESPDGDPSINHVTFRVESSMVSQFAAEREVVLSTEVTETPRIT